MPATQTTSGSNTNNASLIQRSILTVIEPTIKLDKLEMPDIESGTENSNGQTSKIQPSKVSSIIPLVRINQFEIEGGMLKTFRLKNTGFYPTLKLTFSDYNGFFMSRFFPKDGDIIQVYIRSQGDEITFKPIRIDFSIVDVHPIGGGANSANEISVEGRIYVPNLFTEKIQSYNDTSYNTLLSIAEELKLGFASNVDDTSDSMNWINPNDTPEKFIEDIVANSYLDDNSFFTAYIDPYYYLTLVNVNSLFSQDNNVESSLQFYQNPSDLQNLSDGELGDFPNLLSNNLEFQGSARYMLKYQQVNESGEVSKINGYRRYTQYWDLASRKFISEFIDPMTDNTPGLIPLTKGRLIQGKVEGPRNDQVKYKYLGVQSDNVHSDYMYAAIHNHQNLSEITKMGMTVELETVNPAVLRYSRMLCLVYEYSNTIKDVLKNPTVDGSIVADQVERDLNADEDSGKALLNESLSGFYVITGYEYILTDASFLRMRLFLKRREGKATT